MVMNFEKILILWVLQLLQVHRVLRVLLVLLALQLRRDHQVLLGLPFLQLVQRSPVVVLGQVVPMVEKVVQGP